MRWRLFREWFPAASLAAVHVYFPDPWWKKRHKKRRVLNEEFLRDVERTLVPGGRLHFWTDVEEYFQTTLELIAATVKLTGPAARRRKARRARPRLPHALRAPDAKERAAGVSGGVSKQTGASERATSRSRLIDQLTRLLPQVVPQVASRSPGRAAGRARGSRRSCCAGVFQAVSSVTATACGGACAATQFLLICFHSGSYDAPLTRGLSVSAKRAGHLAAADRQKAVEVARGPRRSASRPGQQ